MSERIVGRESGTMAHPNCAHSEGVVLIYEGMTVVGSRDVEGHDCTYVDARNALIPEAEQIANRTVRQWWDKHSDVTKLSHAWIRVFNETMQQLAVARLLHPMKKNKQA